MKRALIISLVLVFLTSTLVGCSKGNNTKTVDKYSTTYATEIKSLNPFVLMDTTAQKVVANSQDGLVENDKLGLYKPSLAESWENNEDFTKWTFKLRQGLKWVDSKGAETKYEVTADDFVESMRYVADPKNGVKSVSIIRNEIVGLKDYNYNLIDIDDGTKTDMTREQALANFDTSVGVKAVDKYTVEYTLTKPVPYFLSYLVTELFLPLEKEFADSVGADNYGITKENMIFSGAYYLSDWQRDKSLTLTKNESYWDKENVKVKTINLQKIADDAVAVQMFQRGELTSATLASDQVKALDGTKWADYVNLTEKSSVTYLWAMNFTSNNPEFKAFVNNVNFRKALYHGIDGAKLQQLDNPYDPESFLRKTIIPEGVVFDSKGVDYTDYPGIKEIKESNPYNPQLAKEYMDKAIAELVGPDGKIKGVEPATVDYLPIAKFDVDGKLPLQFVYVHSTDSTATKFAQLLAEMLKQNLGEGNVNLILGQYVDDLYGEAIEPRKFDMEIDSYAFKYADPMAQLGRLGTDGSVNDGLYSDATFDNLVQEASAMTDIEKRYETFAKAEKHMLDNVLIFPWAAGGGSFQMTNAVPFTTPKGGFGITRFKYKGIVITDKPVTKEEYKKYESQFKEDLKKATQGN